MDTNDEGLTGHQIVALVFGPAISGWIIATIVSTSFGPVGSAVAVMALFMGWLVSAIAVTAYRAGARK